MCGRFTQHRYARMFGLPTTMRFIPRYNVTPSQAVILCRIAHWGAREIVTLTLTRAALIRVSTLA